MQYTGCRPLSDDEYELILHAFEGKYVLRDQAFFDLGIRTGFRISELLAVKVGDIFRDGRMLSTLTVKKSWMKGGKADQTMALHPSASKRLHDWIVAAGFVSPEMAARPLFSRQLTARSLSRLQARSILKCAASRAGVNTDRIASHSMRKTFARNIWEPPFVDKDMAKMARLLGHANRSNTLRYIEFLDGSLDQAVMEMSVS
jgi:integrase